MILPFRVTIPKKEQDPDLSKRIIRTELSGVFNWILKGLNRLLAQKDFTPSGIVQQEVQNYQKQSDTVQLFLDDSNYEIATAQNMPFTSVFNEYRSFCMDSNYRHLSKKAFSQNMKKLGYQLKRKNYGQAIFIEKKVFLKLHNLHFLHLFYYLYAIRVAYVACVGN